MPDVRQDRLPPDRDGHPHHGQVDQVVDDEEGGDRLDRAPGELVELPAGLHDDRHRLPRERGQDHAADVETEDEERWVLAVPRVPEPQLAAQGRTRERHRDRQRGTQHAQRGDEIPHVQRNRETGAREDREAEVPREADEEREDGDRQELVAEQIDRTPSLPEGGECRAGPERIGVQTEAPLPLRILPFAPCRRHTSPVSSCTCSI